MAISRKKHTLIHVSLLLLVLLVGLILLLLPFDVGGKTPSSNRSRAPLNIIQHEQTIQNHRYENKEGQRRIQDQQRRIDNARINVDRAQQDVYNSYIPSLSDPSGRYNNILRAENNLDRAKDELRRRESDLYMEKRILESNMRDQRLKDQRNDLRYRNLRRY